MDYALFRKIAAEMFGEFFESRNGRTMSDEELQLVESVAAKLGDKGDENEEALIDFIIKCAAAVSDREERI